MFYGKDVVKMTSLSLVHLLCLGDCYGMGKYHIDLAFVVKSDGFMH